MVGKELQQEEEEEAEFEETGEKSKMNGKSNTITGDEAKFEEQEEEWLEKWYNNANWISTNVNTLALIFFSALLDNLVTFLWSSQEWQNLAAMGVVMIVILVVGFVIFTLVEWWYTWSIWRKYKDKYTREAIEDGIGKHRQTWASGPSNNTSNTNLFYFPLRANQYAHQYAKKQERKRNIRPLTSIVVKGRPTRTRYS